MKITKKTRVEEIINAPLFSRFGKFIFPLEERMPREGATIDDIQELLPFHTYINSDTTLNVLEYLKEKSKNSQEIFFDYYSEDEKDKDPEKKNTGLFFFQGEKNAPFAVICAGGGFNYVGSIHEGFPYAMEVTKRGYNAFVLQYRVGGEKKAVEDLAAALSFIFKNADKLGVSTASYSLWGSSAGARMAAHIGSRGTKNFCEDDLPKPAAVIMLYTAHTDYSDDERATFAIIGEDDNIVSPPSVMKERLEVLAAQGVDTEHHMYKNLAHGFGLGIGTTAEGWVELALNFWKKQIQ